jgi:hypothetical protein
VSAVRHGTSQRETARRFDVSLRTVQRWLARADGKRLDRVDWRSRSSRPHTTRRTPRVLEDLVLEERRRLREESVLGEYGAEAIRLALEARVGAGALEGPLPSVRTIGRILERRGVLDARQRRRRPAPPAGWYLPAVAARRAELDSFDAVVELKMGGGREIDVLTAISLHGALPGAWPGWSVTARSTRRALLERWRRFGLPGYAQFDNDPRFHGPYGRDDRLGRVTRFCLGLGVVPVFTPPYETGFQAAIEGFNRRWQEKVWSRAWFVTLADLQEHSDRYIAAARAKAAARIESAPPRRPFPGPWERRVDPLETPIIYLRRTGADGHIALFGHSFHVDSRWPHRLVRAEVILASATLRCYALRRRDPTHQPLLAELDLDLPVTLRYRQSDDSEQDAE